MTRHIHASDVIAVLQRLDPDSYVAVELGTHLERILENEAIDPGLAQTQFLAAALEEQTRARRKGYTGSHDDEHGRDHLMREILANLRDGRPIAAAGLVLSLSGHLDRQDEPIAGTFPEIAERDIAHATAALAADEDTRRGPATIVEGESYHGIPLETPDVALASDVDRRPPADADAITSILGVATTRGVITIDDLHQLQNAGLPGLVALVADYHGIDPVVLLDHVRAGRLRFGITPPIADVEEDGARRRYTMTAEISSSSVYHLWRALDAARTVEARSAQLIEQHAGGVEVQISDELEGNPSGVDGVVPWRVSVRLSDHGKAEATR